MGRTCYKTIQIIQKWKRKSPDKIGAKNAVMVLFNHDRTKVFSVRENSGDKMIGFPGGQLEKFDKTIFSGAIREFREETGIKISLSKYFVWSEYALLWIPTKTVFIIGKAIKEFSDKSVFNCTLPINGGDGEVSEMTWIDVKYLLSKAGNKNVRSEAKDSNPSILSLVHATPD